jgi:hypothetical protein
MGLDHVRSEIEHMRVQVGRQRKEILQLQRAGISTASAELLLTRMLAKIDDLCAERDRLKAEQGGQAKSRVLGGRRPSVDRTYRPNIGCCRSYAPRRAILPGCQAGNCRLIVIVAAKSSRIPRPAPVRKLSIPGGSNTARLQGVVVALVDRALTL